MSELKMLTHIGHHANIVNLLGACTESGKCAATAITNLFILITCHFIFSKQLVLLNLLI